MQSQKFILIFVFYLLLLQDVKSNKRDNWDECYEALQSQHSIQFQFSLLKEEYKDLKATYLKCTNNEIAPEGTIKQGTVQTKECQQLHNFNDRSDEKVWEWRTLRQACDNSCKNQDNLSIIGGYFNNENLCDKNLFDSQKNYILRSCFNSCQTYYTYITQSTKPFIEVIQYMDECYSQNQKQACATFDNSIQYWDDKQFLDKRMGCDRVCIQDQDFQFTYDQVLKYKCEQQCIQKFGSTLNWHSLIPEEAKALYGLDDNFEVKVKPQSQPQPKPPVKEDDKLQDIEEDLNNNNQKTNRSAQLILNFSAIMLQCSKRDDWDQCLELLKQQDLEALKSLPQDFQEDYKNRNANYLKCTQNDITSEGTISEGMVQTQECKDLQNFQDRSDEKVEEWRNLRKKCNSSCDTNLLLFDTYITLQDKCDSKLFDSQKVYELNYCFSNCESISAINLLTEKKYKPLSEVNSYMEMCYNTNTNSDCISFNNGISHWKDENFLDKRMKCDNICIKEQEFEFSFAQVEKYLCEQICVKNYESDLKWTNLINDQAKIIWSLDDNFQNISLDDYDDINLDINGEELKNIDIGDITIGKIQLFFEYIVLIIMMITILI